MPSKEQKDFTHKMDMLLSKSLPLFGMEPDAQLGDWMVVISAPSINSDGDLTSGYAIGFSGNILHHNALGLMSKAQDLLDTGHGVDLDE